MQVEVNSYQDIGAYLREVRESLGLQTRDIAQHLNIRDKYLVALEAGDISVMPGKVYARGYVQHYAEYLGLDKEEIAEAFDRVNGNGNGKVNYFVPEPTARNYQPGLLIVGLALVIVMVVYYQWYKNHRAASPRDYEMVSPVPERMLAPIVPTPEMQSNDDIYVDPMLPPDSSLQGDSNIVPPDLPGIPQPATTAAPEAAPEAMPEAPVDEPASEADAPVTAPAAAAEPAPVAEPQAASAPAAEQPRRSAPAPAPAASQPAAPQTPRSLPWMRPGANP